MLNILLEQKTSNMAIPTSLPEFKFSDDYINSMSIVIVLTNVVNITKKNRVNLNLKNIISL